MKFEDRDNQRSRFPKKCNPDIFIIDKGKYKSFGIQSLYLDLFVKVPAYADTTFIIFPNGHKKRKGKDLVSFLLPKEMFEYIEKRTASNDYKEFIVDIHKNNKIAKLMQEMFFSESEKYSGKMFAESFRQHFLIILKDAVFSPYLEAELDSIAKVIIPSGISEVSHNVYNDLKKGGNRSLSIAIANIFASAMLGLFSMKYIVTRTASNKSGIQNAKTYLLNDLGMRYIWSPESVTTSFEELFNIQSSFDHGDLATTCKSVENWLKKHEHNAPSKELAKAYQLNGLALCRLAKSKGEGFNGQLENGIKLLKKSISTGAADPYIYWVLYKHYENKEAETAVEYLKTAFAQNYAKAVIEVAFSHLNNECIFDDITEDLLLQKINFIIENEQGIDAVDIGICLYLRGRFARIQGNNSKANEDFEAASKRGNERARQEISRKKRIERHSIPTFINDSNAPCCYTNTLDGNNSTVISTFPCGTWMMYTSGNTRRNDINTISDIEEFVELQCKFGFSHSKLVFLLMSGNEEKNLNECLILLDKLFNIVLDKPTEIKWQIIDSIDIFVGAKYETSSMLIDANISDMGKDIYFKVHITDENRDTIHKLLCEAPLFLPMLKGDTSTKVVLFGGSEMNYSFIKESIACAYLGSKKRVNAPLIEITLIGENADILEKRFRQECPGIYSNSPRISCIKPQFIKCSVKDADFPGYIYGRTHQQVLDDEGKAADPFTAKMVNVLLDANYFVVDHANDLENIRFAAELRTWLLRSRGTFDRAPFIGVRCSNEQNSYLANHLTLAGQASGNSYFNKYDLFPIGISAQTYSYRNIIDNPVLNNFSLRIHRSYYGDNDRMADNDFYSYSYNADSSLSTAIGLCYRFFAAGIVFNDKDNYLNYGFFNTPNIESKFEEIYKEKLEYLASLEQSRWNGFMLSRGWESANVSQVEAYKEQSTGSSHKHTLAKLHPFIKEWDDLDDPQLERVLGILKSRFNYDRRPQVTTITSIESTAKFFKAIEKKNEKIR